MICNSCRRTLLSRLHHQTRSFSWTAKASQTPATSSSTPGISQPLSTPSFPSTSSATSLPSSAATADGTKEATKKTKPQSSIAGGVELKGLAYLKATPRILAKEDDEYPAWLWTILEDKTQTDGKPSVDVAALTKKQRAKYERKQAILMRDIPKPIPIHEQSRDLTQPGDDAATSLDRRQELTKSSREARRKEIRESNYLKGV